MPEASVVGSFVREALRDIKLDYIHRDLFNNLVNLNDNWCPTRLHTAEQVLPWNEAEGAREAELIAQFNRVASYKSFKYGLYQYYMKLAPYTNDDWTELYLGAETAPGALGGLASFHFNRTNKAVYARLYGFPLGSGYRSIDVQAFVADPTADYHLYTVKVNRASVDYWVDGELVAILQAVAGADTYTVRETAPYVLGQVGGSLPTVNPALIEPVATAGHEGVGVRPGMYIKGITIIDGDPAPPRTLHPITGGVNWEGTTGVDPDITSDRIPIAGYNKKQIYFLATGAGDLEIYVDYGDNNVDLIDTVSVTANTLESYLTETEALWLALKYIPSSPPADITRARVLMR